MFRFTGKIALPFLLLFAFSKAYTQSLLHVESLENQTPLAYASIVNNTKHQLVFTDEEGNASVDFANGDSIIISYVGYYSLQTIFNLAAKSTYALKQRKDLLETVRIENCKSWKQAVYSNMDADTGTRKFGGVSFDTRAMNERVAIMLQPGVVQGQLKSFSIWLRRESFAPKISVQAPIKLSFYNIEDSSGLPGELISNKQIIYHPKKEGKQSIGLDSLHLKIPAAGLYVCIEYPLNTKYEWPIKLIDAETGVHSIAIRYGACLDGIYSKDFALAFFNYENGTWFFPPNINKDNIAQRHGTIKCTVEIITCEDNH